jgi:hypothetical protein
MAKEFYNYIFELKRKKKLLDEKDKEQNLNTSKIIE